MANRINDTSSLNVGSRVIIGDPEDTDSVSNENVIVIAVHDMNLFTAVDTSGDIMNYTASDVVGVMDTVVIAPIINALVNMI